MLGLGGVEDETEARRCARILNASPFLAGIHKESILLWDEIKTAYAPFVVMIEAAREKEKSKKDVRASAMSVFCNEVETQIMEVAVGYIQQEFDADTPMELVHDCLYIPTTIASADMETRLADAVSSVVPGVVFSRVVLAAPEGLEIRSLEPTYKKFKAEIEENLAVVSGGRGGVRAL